MADYHLYAHRNSYAMTTHLLLEELDIEYDVTWFNVHDPESFPKEFIELNPNAKVPVLITPDGPVYESAATLMVLSENHDNRFMPIGNCAQRSKALQWLFYLMSTFQPEVLIQFNVQRYFTDGDPAQTELLAASLRELETIWQIIEDALNPGPWFLGEEYSLCDILFLMQAVWKENQPSDLDKFPNAVRMMQSAFTRPAVERVMAIHEINHLKQI